MEEGREGGRAEGKEREEDGRGGIGYLRDRGQGKRRRKGSEGKREEKN